MANNPIWSKEKKNYVKAMITNKKLLFANVRGIKNANWKEENKDYDIIIGYCYADDIYYACDARFHFGKHNASFDCTEFANMKPNEIVVGYRKIADYPTLKERILMIPCRQLEVFCKAYSFYLTKYRDENDPISLGIFDKKTQTIKQKMR